MRRLRAYAREPGGADVEPVASTAQRSADSAAAAPVIARALAALPRGERDALLLHVWGELSYRAVAAALGIPEGTVRSRIHRARGQLRAQLSALAPTQAPRGASDG